MAATAPVVDVLATAGLWHHRIRSTLVLEPVLQPAWVMPDVRVAKASQQADRLLAERSGGTAAVGDDVGVAIGKKFSGARRDVGNRQVDRAWNVKRDKRFGRQHVDEHDPAVAHRTDELGARNRRRTTVRR